LHVAPVSPRRRLVKRTLLVAGAGIVVVAAVIGTQLWRTYQTIETEEFDPAAAGEAMATRTEEVEAAPLRPPASADVATTAGSVPRVSGAYERQLTRAAEAVYLVDVLAGVQRPFELVPQQIEHAESPPLPDAMFEAYLLVGSDLSGERADAIILGLVPSDGSDPILASIPRDLYMTNPCTGVNDRINSTLMGCPGYATGSELLALAVQQFTGVEVDHLVRADFDGFASIIDALGGVELCVEAPTRDEKAHFELSPGCHQADGELALAWARSRTTEEQHDGVWRIVAGNDFTRQQKQQELLFKVAGRVASFSSLGSFTSVAQEIAEAVKLDAGFSVTEALGLAWQYRTLQPEDVQRVALSFADYRTAAGAAVLLPSQTFNSALAEVYPPAAR
jgi:LCP family protein required for cell wall assembly